MKVLLIGDVYNNSGPSNVNKNIIANSNNKIMYIKSRNKVIKRFELLFKFLKSDIIIISGYGNNNYFYSKICKKINKKTIYIMHGCVKYENEINKLGLRKKIVENELLFIKNVDIVLCVSENYSKWVRKYYNIDKNIFYLNNGIINDFKKNQTKQEKMKKDFQVVLIGGNRNIKNNKIVCDVLDEMISCGYNIKYKLFGRIYKNNEIIDSKNAKICGMVPYEELCDELNKTNLYICNSIVESFNLSVFDALLNGCDVLLSNNVGALSLLKANSHDIIYNCMDKNEIKNKILYLMNHSNCKRIVNSISKESSWKYSTKTLLDYCEKLLKKDNKNEKIN